MGRLAIPNAQHCIKHITTTPASSLVKSISLYSAFEPRSAPFTARPKKAKDPNYLPLTELKMIGLYSPLDSERHEARLVTIFPGLSNDPISCTLSVISNDDPPEYDALSYVWGTLEVVSPIFVDAFEIPVTQNLSIALRHLRYQDRPRTMWIDALCINQQDAQERIEQVQLMGDIYAKAERVLVWLGLRTQDLDKAMDLINELASAQHIATLPKPRSLGTAVHYDQPEDDDIKKLDPLQKYVDSAWFRRTWVLQEVSLARKAILCCGDRHIEWDDITNFLTWRQHHMECCIDILPLRPKKALMDSVNKMGWLQGIRSHLAADGILGLTLLESEARNRSCTDDHDRIYGYLGIMKKLFICPDY